MKFSKIQFILDQPVEALKSSFHAIKCNSLILQEGFKRFHQWLAWLQYLSQQLQIKVHWVGLWLSQCQSCHSLLGFKLNSLTHCWSCDQALENQIGGRARRNRQQISLEDRPCHVWSLYQWKPGQSDELTNTLYRLKGLSYSMHWQSVAKAAIDDLWPVLMKHSCVLVIPMPNSSAGSNPVEGFAKALRLELCNRAFWSCRETQIENLILPAKFTSQQKAVKSRLQRQARVLNSISPGPQAQWTFSEHPQNHSLRACSDLAVLLCDDVYVTGSSARAVIKALGLSCCFYIAVHSHRSLLENRPEQC